MTHAEGQSREADCIGERLMLNYISALAVDNPDKVAFWQVLSNNEKIEVTYRHLENMINQIVSLLDSDEDRNEQRIDTYA